MTDARRAIISKLWGGEEPFAGVEPTPDRVDYQGWASENPMLVRSLEEVGPQIIVEVGVWKGGSVITMAEHLRANNRNAAIIAVDTWLGAAEHWVTPSYRPSLRIERGFPTLYETFVANIIDKDLSEYVVPLPVDSINASKILEKYNIVPDILHIDGGHDYNSVLSDLRSWWPLLAAGGILIGDDYHPVGIEVWPEVRAAFHDFFKVTEIENYGGKCVVRKPGSKFLAIPQVMSDSFRRHDEVISCEEIINIPRSVNYQDVDWYENDNVTFFPLKAGVSQVYAEVRIVEKKFLSTRFMAHGVLFDETGYFNNYGFLFRKSGSFQKLVVNQDDQSVHYDASVLQDIPIVLGKFLLPFDGNSFNYYHFVLEGLVSISIFRLLGLNYVPIICVDANGLLDWQKEYFELMDQAAVLIINGNDRDIVSLQEVFYLKDASLPNIPARALLDFSSTIKRSAGAMFGKTAYRKIYVKRREGQRSLANADAVEYFLSERGFEVVELEQMPVSAQVRLFSEAKVVVGPHGAGLVNTIYCSPSAKVIDMIPDSEEVRKFFWLLAQKIGLDYYFIKCSAPNGYGGKLTVDMEALRKTILAVEAEDNLMRDFDKGEPSEAPFLGTF